MDELLQLAMALVHAAAMDDVSAMSDLMLGALPGLGTAELVQLVFHTAEVGAMYAARASDVSITETIRQVGVISHSSPV